MTTRARPFYWIDAFADAPFSGNPCAVVFDAGDVTVADRIAFTRETRLSECAFLQDPTATGADFAVRYYTAAGEILMAGHPTIATVTALLAAGRVAAPSRFALEVGAGVLPIEVAADGAVTMTQAAPRFLNRHAPEAIAPIVGLEPADFLPGHPPRTVSTGTPFLIAPLVSIVALRRARLDLDRLAAAHAWPDAEFREPFLCVLEGATPAGDTFARLLLAPPEPAEDPYTGSATGCMAAYLWNEGLLAAPRFVAEQGHDMGRPGSGVVELVGPRDAIAGVRLTGRGIAVMRGEALL